MPKLTDAMLRSAKRQPGSYYDEHGLVMVISQTRAKWLVRRKGADGRYSSDRIGYFPAMSLAQARAGALARSERAKDGVPAAPARAEAPGKQTTVGQLVDATRPPDGAPATGSRR